MPKMLTRVKMQISIRIRLHISVVDFGSWRDGGFADDAVSLRAGDARRGELCPRVLREELPDLEKHGERVRRFIKCTRHFLILY